MFQCMMSESSKITTIQGSSNITLYLILGIALTLVLLLNPLSTHAFAQISVSNMYSDNQLKSQNNTLFVSGFATQQTASDLVTISIGVQSTNKTATDALASNSEIANKLISALMQNGVLDTEISTSRYSIQPNYNYSQYGNILNTTGFTVSNIVTIQSANLNKVSQWIDSAVSAGANTINSVDFNVSPKSLGEIKKTLIDQAISDARGKAQIAATAVGSNIIGIKSISINADGFNPLPLHDEMFQKSFVSESTPTPIIPGQQQISVSVQVTYLLN